MPTLSLPTISTLILAVMLAEPAAAACVNRFLVRSEKTTQVVTLLTGRLTFQEAQALAASIKDGKAPQLEWVDEKGKTLARQVGDLRVVRPMPVGCEGRSSGVVLITSFMRVSAPSRRMHVKLNGAITQFEEQAK
jgi:hypothetical protein